VLELEVRDGDIADVEADALANAANDQLWMGAGVSGALEAAGERSSSERRSRKVRSSSAQQ
jgi:O-acetyl-ADP-ribose deacetylase (regulator of RNase III)